MSQSLTNLEALTDKFDAFLIDQFGVLLSGEGIYPCAPIALKRLSEMGKRIILISNSGRRSEPNNVRLVTSGFVRDSFEMVLSSGEVAYGYLEQRIGNSIPAGAKVLVISLDDDASSIVDLSLSVTQDPDEAELIIMVSCRRGDIPLEAYRDILERPAKRGVLCLCTNPDMIKLTSKGTTFSTGRIAKLYEEAGGKVEWAGKPYPLIYEKAYEILGKPDPTKILCIGDSPAHDIKGGQAAGFATALVRTGIHAEMSDAKIAVECSELGAVPDYIIPDFSYSLQRGG